jgi:hypothetical protein
VAEIPSPTLGGVLFLLAGLFPRPCLRTNRTPLSRFRLSPPRGHFSFPPEPRSYDHRQGFSFAAVAFTLSQPAPVLAKWGSLRSCRVGSALAEQQPFRLPRLGIPTYNHVTRSHYRRARSVSECPACDIKGVIPRQACKRNRERKH